MGFQKIKNNEREINFGKTRLSKSQEIIFKRTSELYSKFLKIQQLYEMFLKDFVEFNTSFHNFERGLSKRKNGSFSPENDFNRLLVHILSSGVLLVTYFENEMLRKYKRGSKEFVNWKKKLGEIYDNNFAYRLCYHLRNYTQHEGLAIARMESRIGNKNPEKELTCTLTIDPQTLLNTRYNWKKEIADELRSIKTSIDVRNLLSDFMDSIILIYGIQNEIFLECNHRELMELRERHKSIYSEDKNPVLIITNKEELKRGTVSSLRPLITLQHINKIYYELSKIGLVDFKITTEKQ